MAKIKTEIKIKSYGIFTKWNRESKELPKLLKVTTRIPAVLDTEFGVLLEIKKGKGKTLEFLIEHPPLKDEQGNYMPDFEGEYFIRTNNYEFFIGDCIWEPEEEKKGDWVIHVYFEGREVVNQRFVVS